MEANAYGVFWDIENVVYVKEPELRAKIHQAVLGVLCVFPVYMQREGYARSQPHHLAFAKEHLPGLYVRLLRNAGYDIRFTRRQGKSAADREFVRAVQESLDGRRPPLPPLVVIISGDRDFCPVAGWLRKLGHTVWVLGWNRRRTSHVLRRHADRFLTFSRLFFSTDLSPRG